MGSLTDTHCHLNLNSFEEDLPAVLARARKAGVYRILVPGIDLDTSRRAVEIADSHAEIFAAVGIHPNDALAWDVSDRNTLRELASHPKVVAIGEIGLDYYRDRAPKDHQMAVLAEQLALAESLNLPVVLHNRNAFSDLWATMQVWVERLRAIDSPLAARPGVFHSFEGTLEEAQQAAEGGFFLGISGPVTYKNAHERHQIAACVALDRLLIETDAPFLTPAPHRGSRNEPAFTHYIGTKIAELHELDFDTIAEITAGNATRLFAWEP